MTDVQIVPGLEPLAEEIESLNLLPFNPRVGDIPAVAKSLDAFGQRKPIVVRRSDRTVIAGNHTLQAAMTLGWDRIAVLWVDDDEATSKAFALADNRTAELGGYEDEYLAAMMQEVNEAGMLLATGWNEGDLTELLGALEGTNPTADTDKDEAPPVPPTPFSKPGDLWLLGPHRVLCGDARSPSDMNMLLDEALADLVWTDPPYGVAVQGGTKDKLTILNDEVDGDKLEKLLSSAFRNVFEHTRPGAGWYVASPSGPFFCIFGSLLNELGVWRQTIAWVKDSLVLGRADYHGRHESIFYGWTPDDVPSPPPPMDVSDATSLAEDEAMYAEGYDNVIYGWTPGAPHQAPPTRKQDSVWEFPKPRKNPDHPTMKPVELIDRAIRNTSKAGALVLDPFGGSGSTLIACHHTGRKARLIELDPRYVDVICRRYQEHAGVVPVNAVTGEQHDFRVVAD